MRRSMRTLPIACYRETSIGCHEIVLVVEIDVNVVSKSYVGVAMVAVDDAWFQVWPPCATV